MSKVLSFDICYQRNSFSLSMNAEISKGITGVYGPSGSGKSTFLKLIAGIETPDDGLIVLNERTLFCKNEKINLKLRKRKVGMVFQEGRLFPHMSVRKNLMYGYSENSRFGFSEVVDLLELNTLLDKRPDECSGGEQQRIAIGRMLLHSPDLLLLDEPFSALDQRLRRHIIPFLLKINHQFQLPVIVVSHDLSDLLLLADQLLLIHNGQVAGVGAYVDLIMKHESDCCLFGQPIVNSVKVKVVQKSENGFLYRTEWPENLLVTEDKEPVSEGDQVFFSLYPEDISVSLGPVAGISARNQLNGTLLQMKPENGQVLCLVDVGFSLIVKITSAAAEGLNLQEGMQVWCIFKTSAIRNKLVIGS